MVRGRGNEKEGEQRGRGKKEKKIKRGRWNDGKE